MTQPYQPSAADWWPRETADNETPTERWQAVMQDNYGTPPVTLVSGQGSWVTDDGGRRYLDLLGGIAVNALGHAHPAIVAAVSEQVRTLGHTSNLAITLPALQLCERLALIADPMGGARVFLCNSGAEANEAAFKLVRLTGRTRMVAAANGFHGRTMGALALTGQPAKADPFRPLPGEVDFVPYGDVEALRAAVDEQTAAIILEPIQGEAGVVVPPEGYLVAARRIADDVGALLILDEVQTGIGRTGRWLAHHAPEHHGIRPDVITLAKGLGGGLPIGAMIRLGHPNTPEFTPGSHGSTFGGNPISAAAALSVLDTITSRGPVHQCHRAGRAVPSGPGSPRGCRRGARCGAAPRRGPRRPDRQGGRSRSPRGRRPGQCRSPGRDPAGAAAEHHCRRGRPRRRAARAGHRRGPHPAGRRPRHRWHPRRASAGGRQRPPARRRALG